MPFVPPVPGVGFERTERGLRSVGIYAVEYTTLVLATGKVRAARNRAGS